VKAAGKSFEVVFASSDRDQASFDEYFGEMPWLALPFEDRDAKNALSKKWKVRGIPTLVLVDGKTGETITTKGREAVSDVEAYPWKPPSLNDLVQAAGLKAKDGTAVDLKDLGKRGAYLGLYFSAHWCPPCRGFTPELVKAYEACKAAGKELEVAFVSSDRDQAAFDEYYGEMPWACVPFEDRATKEKLSSALEVEGIPTFVMLSVAEDGAVSVLNADARSEVGAEEAPGADFPWRAKAVKDLEDVDGSIEDTPSVVVLMEEAGEAWEGAEAALGAVAEKLAGEGKEGSIKFWTAKELGGPTSQVRKLCGLGPKPKAGEVSLVLLDLSEGGYYACESKECTVETVTALVEGFSAGKLEKLPLKK